jgi:dipeptidyl aminopeptidase/acylaminoacyl peptidase
MQRDLRTTETYRSVEALVKESRRPGTGQISDAHELHAAPDGTRAVFAGVVVDALQGIFPTRICEVELTSGDLRVLTFGPNTDRLPKYAPDGRRVAFLSDRLRAGDFQLHILDLSTGAVHATPPVDGWVEYLHWSVDGTRILLAVAGHGADVAGGQGAVTSSRHPYGDAAWMPTVETNDADHQRRHVWLYDLKTDCVHRLQGREHNVWEAAWCGANHIVAVTSRGSGEGDWYNACLQLFDVAAGDWRNLYVPRAQLGWPTASPSGAHLAVVEGICSDRWIVAGDLLLLSPGSGEVRRIDTKGVDVAYAEWRSDRQLLLAGHRGFDTVVATYDVLCDSFIERWSDRNTTTGGRYAAVSGVGGDGDCVLVGEGFDLAPEIAIVQQGAYRAVRSFDLVRDRSEPIRTSCVRWSAPDGLAIEGWLLQPPGDGPFPLVMNLHGGPVAHWRPHWLRRNALGLAMLALLARGIAIVLPNPRGSAGRGQDFVRHVVGDMAGADAGDCLAGIEQLIACGTADPDRLGVMGGSYGGYLTCWLVTQSSCFAAAVALAPVTNQVSKRLMSAHSTFVALFLDPRFDEAGGKYFQRSPIMHVRNVSTPILNVCGALDRCTPPEEAIQFHNALIAQGSVSALVRYPEEGHGIRRFPSAIDYATRVVLWFEEHIAP